MLELRQASWRVATATERRRRATGAFFAFNGVIFATWCTEIPRVKLAAGVSDAALGVVLAAVTLGTILALPFIGRAIARWGDAAVAVAATTAATASLLAVPFATGVLDLFLLVLAFGCAFGAQDVALNDAGVRVERDAGRPTMSGLHAMYSLGALLGAVAGATLIASGVNAALHFALLAPAAAFLCLVAARDLPHETSAGPEAAGEVVAPSGARPALVLAWPIVTIGLVAACAAAVEGGVGDWAAVYLKETARGPEGVEALGFGALSLAMLCGRLAGDRLSERHGPVVIGQGGALLAAFGALVVVAAPTPAAAVLGFGVAGLGVSVLAPLAFSAVGHAVPGDASGAIASVTALFYGGYLLSPLAIGAIAGLGSLRGALLVLVAAALAAAALAPALRGKAAQIPAVA